MSVADRSQTERIRRMRAQIQAVRRAECFTCLEEGPQGPVDQSTRVSRKFGQATYYRQNASGAIITESCCKCCTGAVNFDDLNAYTESLTPSITQTIISYDCKSMTYSYYDGVTRIVTVPIRYVQSDFTYYLNPGYVIINNSNKPVQAINIHSTPNHAITLNPCGAVISLV